MNAPYVIQLDLSLAMRLKTDLIAQGFTLGHPPYTLFQAKKRGLSCTLYASGKLVVQGSAMREFIENYLEPELLGEVRYGYESHLADPTARIGIDESGKGDFFGPLSVAGLFAEGSSVGALIEMGVKDSKQLSDATILKLASRLRTNYVHHIIRLNPEKYNELYQRFGNLNSLLAWCHATTIAALAEKTGCRRAHIDQFAKEHVVENALKRHGEFVLIQRHKAEQDPVVAGASILARADFLTGLENLESLAHERLPKGASQAVVSCARRLAEREGLGILKSVAKIHFSTYARVSSELGK